jgi:TetR/AcrR family tetracycline transcriptional repressor
MATTVRRLPGSLDPKEFPVLRQSARILFDKFDRRYKEGLDLMLRGAITAP